MQQNQNRSVSQHKGANQQGPKGKFDKKSGRVYYTNVSDIPEGEPMMTGMFPVANHSALTLFDSGASHTFINRTFVVKHGITIGQTQREFNIQSPGGQISTTEMVYNVPIKLSGQDFPTNMIVLKNQDIDVILGMNWMYHHGAIIDIMNRTVRINLPDKSSHLLIQLPFPQKTTEKACVASPREIESVPVVCEFPDVFQRNC